jgi:CBS domain containing-hemolysin-like protein
MDDSFETLIVKMNKAKTHRLWIVNDDQVVQGVVSLKDLLKEMVHH